MLVNNQANELLFVNTHQISIVNNFPVDEVFVNGSVKDAKFIDDDLRSSVKELKQSKWNAHAKKQDAQPSHKLRRVWLVKQKDTGNNKQGTQQKKFDRFSSRLIEIAFFHLQITGC
jgi:hypothetical protein